MAWFVPHWLALAALYLAYVGEVSTPELAVALSGGLAVTAYRLTISRRGRPYAFGFFAALKLCPSILAAICRDVMKLTFAFMALIMTRRRLRGSFTDIAFDPGIGDASSRCRRSLVIAGISFSPNTYVVALRYPQRRLTLHALLPINRSRDVQWPL